MRTTGHMGLAAVLGVALGFATGCSSKTEPGDQPNASTGPNGKSDAKAEPSAPLKAERDPKIGPEPQPVVKAVHEMDTDKHFVALGPITGNVGGAEFTPEVVVEGDYLVFRTAKTGSLPDRKVMLKLRTDDKLFENRKVVVRTDVEAKPGADVPEVFIEIPPDATILYDKGGYALTLELGVRKSGKLPGRIYLCFPDEKKTFIAGTFTADAPRQPTDPPGEDDVPFINGSVAVREPAANAAVRVGYFSSLTTEMVSCGAAEIELGPSQWTKWVYDKPRVTNLIAGDGKMMPSRYEHSRLAPGRHLIFAGINQNGPFAWKWVSVSPNSTVTTDFTLDPTQTGGVEIGGIPQEAFKVHLVPADDGATPLSASTFLAASLHLQMERDVVARKVLYKNLAPGKYEVRAAGQSRIVEIAAGKTAELDFDKKDAAAPPPPPK